jgi:outer membrane protein TolC
VVRQENREAAGDVAKIEAGRDLGPVQERPAKNLNLQDAIDQALRQNLGLNIQRYQPSLVADSVEQARAAFDPVLGVGASVARDQSPAPGATGVRAQSETQDYTARVTQLTPSGATVQVNNDVSRFYAPNAPGATNPQFNSALGVSVSQPLLRGFGETVNLAPIVLARASYQQSLLELQSKAFDVISETEIAYWNLAAAYAFKALRETNIQVAQTLLDETRARNEVGLVKDLDVLQAQANLASRREEIIIAQQDIEDAEDRLRALLGNLQFEPATAVGVAALPDAEPPLPDFNQSVQAALAFDLDTQVQYVEVEKRRLQTIVARDQNRPSLDLSLNGASLGRDRNGLHAVGDSFAATGYRWGAGVELSVPWGMRDSNAQEREANKNLEVAALQIATIQQDLMLRLRSAWRAISAGRERRVTTAAALAYNLAAFDYERAVYSAGNANFRNVLEAQRDLDQARLSHLQSLIELIRASISLSRIDGSLLQRHGFEWREVVPGAQPRNPAAAKIGPPASGTGPSDRTTPSTAILPGAIGP